MGQRAGADGPKQYQAIAGQAMVAHTLAALARVPRLAATLVVLAADDMRAFAPPPAGFADAQPGVPQGRVEEFSYDSAVTGTRRTASVYLPPGYTEQRRYPVL